MRRPISALAMLLALTGGALANQDTGSRVGSDSVQRAVAQVHQPAEIETIERLINAGRHQQAVELARNYEARIRTTTALDESVPGEQHYAALNALCNALMSAGNIQAAVDACTRAIDLIPSRWVAINSRATAYYSARRFEDALRDYRRALAVAPSEPAVVDTIEHNMRLTEQRLGATDP